MNIYAGLRSKATRRELAALVWSWQVNPKIFSRSTFRRTAPGDPVSGLKAPHGMIISLTGEVILIGSGVVSDTGSKIHNRCLERGPGQDLAQESSVALFGGLGLLRRVCRRR